MLPETLPATASPGAADGSAALSAADGTSLAVDFSGTSGADGILVMTGPGVGAGTKVTAGGTTLDFLFLTAVTEPTPEVQGDQVLIGRQSVTIREGHLVLGQMAGLWQE